MRWEAAFLRADPRRMHRIRQGHTSHPSAEVRVWLVGVTLLAVALSASAQPDLDQVHYRWRNDDGSEAAATFPAGQDTKLAGLTKNATQRDR